MPSSFCTACGRALASDAVYCAGCGHSPRTPAPQPPVSHPHRSSTGPLLTGIAIGVTVAVMALVGMGAWISSRFEADARAIQSEELTDFTETDTLAVPTASAPAGEDAGAGTAGTAVDAENPGVPAAGYELEEGANAGGMALEVWGQPSLLNDGEVAKLLRESHPPLLRDAGVGGSAEVRFRVGSDGVVDPASVFVLRSSHEEFALAAARIVPRMRFQPASYNGEPFPTWVELPLTFQVPPR